MFIFSSEVFLPVTFPSCVPAAMKMCPQRRSLRRLVLNHCCGASLLCVVPKPIWSFFNIHLKLRVFCQPVFMEALHFVLCFCNSQSSTKVLSLWSSRHWEVGRSDGVFFDLQTETRHLSCSEMPGLVHDRIARECWSPTPAVFPLTALPRQGNQVGSHIELSDFPLKSSQICSDI